MRVVRRCPVRTPGCAAGHAELGGAFVGGEGMAAIAVRRRFIVNNEIWGMSLHGQQILYGENYSAISSLGGRNYAAIAAAFGCYGERVTKFADIAPALNRAFESGGPACIEIMTDKTVVHPGFARNLSRITGDEKEIVIPYYENIPLSRH